MTAGSGQFVLPSASVCASPTPSEEIQCLGVARLDHAELVVGGVGQHDMALLGELTYVDVAGAETSSRRHGSPLRLVAVAFDIDDLERVAAFWASILGRDVVRETGSVLLPGDDTQAEVARLVALGASELGERDGRIVLADPDGGEFSLGRA